MSVTIGRVGTDGITIPDPDISWSGDQVSLSGQYTPDAGSATGLADTLWLREQLLGLVGSDDEPVVPVTWSDRGEFDGYYRPTDVQASLPVGSTKEAEPFLPWSVTLERVKDYRQPPLEVFGVYGIVSNALGITGADTMTAAPSLAVDWWPNVGTTTGTRVADTGTLQIIVDISSPISTTYLSRLSIAPAYYYIGACRAEYAVDNTPTWRTVIGRRAFTTSDIPAANSVRISNGLVRVRPTATTLQVQWYNGSAWSAATSFQLTQGASANVLNFIVGRVLLSSPTEVVLRIEAIIGGSGVVPYTVDLRLRRGSRNVQIRLAAYLSDSFGLRFASAVPSTTLTGGLRRTTNNADGNRELLISNTATTKNTSVGSITDPTIRNSVLFGIGAEVGGSSAASLDVAARQVSEWFMSVSETQRVVAG
jgi:hypothetical protein